MKLSRHTQIEAGEGRNCNQEVDFWFRQRPVVGYCCAGLHRKSGLRNCCHIHTISVFVIDEAIEPDKPGPTIKRPWCLSRSDPTEHLRIDAFASPPLLANGGLLATIQLASDMPLAIDTCRRFIRSMGLIQVHPWRRKLASSAYEMSQYRH